MVTRRHPIVCCQGRFVSSLGEGHVFMFFVRENIGVCKDKIVFFIFDQYLKVLNQVYTFICFRVPVVNLKVSFRF